MGAYDLGQRGGTAKWRIKEIMNSSGPHLDSKAERSLGALRNRARQALDWIGGNVPPGVRLVLGLLLIGGGLLGFLPVLGFWMIPLGIAVAAIDVRSFLRLLRSGSTGPR